MTIKWNAEQVFQETNRRVERNMTKAMAFAEGQAKNKVSIGNLGGDTPSQPGEPPRVVTGTLRANIGHEVRKERNAVIGVLGVKKGPADDYAPRLELGFTGTDSLGRTYNQKPRPFLRPTIQENGDRILKIIRG